MIDDGVIKFIHTFIAQTTPLVLNEYDKLEQARRVLFRFNLIGAYNNGIGFGNLSIKADYSSEYVSTKPQFLISGTQTGHLPELSGEHYTKVVDYNLDDNEVKVIGPIKASSESLTHAAIFESSDNITSVIHIHHLELWQKMLDLGYQKIPADIAYGTQEMANYAAQIVQKSDQKDNQLFVMEGHREGIIFFGDDLQECLERVLEIFHKLIPS